MSSYLNFYLLPKVNKADNSKKLLIYSTSRSSELYQAFFQEGVTEAYRTFSEDAEEHFTKLTKEFMQNICSEYYENILKAQNNINELEKHANGNTDIIHEIIDNKDYLEELKETYHHLCFIKYIVEDLTLDDYYGFEGVYANIG